MIGLMGVLTSIISWVICVFAVISSVAVTVVLWITYFDIRKTEDAKIKYTHFEEFLQNETVVYATAIIATVIMVIYLFQIFRDPYRTEIEHQTITTTEPNLT